MGGVSHNHRIMLEQTDEDRIDFDSVKTTQIKGTARIAEMPRDPDMTAESLAIDLNFTQDSDVH